jgi:hypothetical protein
MFDYIDFGTSKGSNQVFLQEQIGLSGFGIDKDSNKAAICIQNGFPCRVADVGQTLLPDKCCKVVGIVHVLEHLSGYDEALLVLKEACRLANCLVYIVVPYFDADLYLKRKGLYLEWSRYVGHTYHIVCSDFRKLSTTLAQKIVINRKHPILSTHYPAVKGQKSDNVEMLRDVYRELEILMWLD